MAYNGGGGDRKFDLDKYETVKSRKERVRADNPNCLIYPMQISGMHYANNFVVFLSLIWKDKTTKNNTPDAIKAVSELCKGVTADNASIVASTIGLILNADSTGFSLSIAGGRQADKNAWVENCEESATGRALDNLGYHSGSASREEMMKVDTTKDTMNYRSALEASITERLNYFSQSQNYDLAFIHNTCMNAINAQFTHLHELGVMQLETIKEYLLSIN